MGNNFILDNYFKKNRKLYLKIIYAKVGLNGVRVSDIKLAAM